MQNNQVTGNQIETPFIQESHRSAQIEKRENTSSSSALHIISDPDISDNRDKNSGINAQSPIRRNNEASHRRLHRHNRNFSKNFRRIISRRDNTAIDNNRQPQQHTFVNPMVISLTLCMSVYMVITFASDVAIFYKPSWSPVSDRENNNVVAFGVGHGREILFSPVITSDSQQQHVLKSAEETPEVSDENILRAQQETKKVSSSEKKNSLRKQPVLSNIRKAKNVESIPIFYPPEYIREEDEPRFNDWNLKFSFNGAFRVLNFNRFSKFTLLNNNDFSGSSAFVGVIVGIFFSIVLIVYGPNEVRKILVELRSHRLQAHVYRSR